MTPLDTLRDQLVMLRDARRSMAPSDTTYRYLGNEAMVLAHGTVYRRMPLPVSRQLQVVPRQCFAQSYRAAVGHPRSAWIYVEGFALSSVGLATLHAWVTRADSPNCAYDLAWEWDATTPYLGIPFRTRFVREMFSKSGRKLHSILDCPWAGWPLLTGAIQLSDVMSEIG